jgi:6-phosphogluconolactonase (cycloisomerase 2 family)
VLAFPAVTLGGHRRALGLTIAAVAMISAVGVAVAATAGKLKFVNAKIDGQGGVTGLDFAWDVVVSPDGRSVYATGDNSDAVVTFKRNRDTGKLRYVNTKVDGQGGVEGLDGANGLAMSADARNLYVTGAVDNSIVTFRRKPKTGKLRFVNAKVDGQGGVDGINSAEGVAVAPGNKIVYVTGYGDNAVATFKRRPKTGKLRFVDALFDGQGGVDGLGGAFEVAASPDFNSVYVASENDNAVATFARGRKGKLRFVNAKFDGQGGAMLEYATGIQVSPDSRNVYVSAAHDNAVDTFKRNRDTGKLKFVNAKVDGQGGVDGIASTFDLTVAPDGRNVYASGNADNAVATFKRRPRTGKLRFVDARFDGQGGVDGLVGAYFTSSSPDGDNVYVTADQDNSVVTFRRR